MISTLSNIDDMNVLRCFMSSYVCNTASPFYFNVFAILHNSWLTKILFKRALLVPIIQHHSTTSKLMKPLHFNCIDVQALPQVS